MCIFVMMVLTRSRYTSFHNEVLLFAGSIFVMVWTNFAHDQPQKYTQREKAEKTSSHLMITLKKKGIGFFFRSWIRENDFVQDSWKEKILFVNSWKLKKSRYFLSWFVFVNWQNYFKEIVTTPFRSSIVREFVKIKNIVCEFVNRISLGGLT